MFNLITDFTAGIIKYLAIQTSFSMLSEHLELTALGIRACHKSHLLLLQVEAPFLCLVISLVTPFTNAQHVNKKRTILPVLDALLHAFHLKNR